MNILDPQITALAPSPALSIVSAMVLFFAADGIGRLALRRHAVYPASPAVGLVFFALCGLLLSALKIQPPQIAIFVLQMQLFGLALSILLAPQIIKKKHKHILLIIILLLLTLIVQNYGEYALAQGTGRRLLRTCSVSAA